MKSLEVSSTPVSASAEAIRRAARNDGYLFVRELVDPTEVVALREVVVEACRRVGWLLGDAAEPPADPALPIGDHRSPPYAELQSTVQSSPEFLALARSSSVQRVLETIFDGPVVRQSGDVCRVSSPFHGVPTVPHQDHFYTRQPTWTVWIPLGACPRALGGLAVLPGSHRQGLRPHQPIVDDQQGIVDLDDAPWATADFHCGDVLMFASLTVHRALPNTTRSLRLSVDYRFGAATE